MAYSPETFIFSHTKFEPPQSARTVEEHAEHLAWYSLLKRPFRRPPKNIAQTRNQVPHYQNDPRNLAACVEQYPIALAVVCQIILLGVITCIMWRCLRPNAQVGEAGSSHPSGWQPRQNVQVHVNVGDRAFAKPLRGPEPREEGLPAPGTPARPLS